MESDWKKFRDMVPKLRDRYLAECNERIAAILGDPRKDETERFWDAFDAMKREARVLRDCLDGHSRSNMWLFMMKMAHAGMLTKADLTVFSDELQQKVGFVLEQSPD